MRALWRSVATPHGCVVVVGATSPDPTDDEIERWAELLDASGCDALAVWVPSTDALVRLDGGEVVEHVDRAAHGRLGLPQVVTDEWWNRFRSRANGGADDASDGLPAQVIGYLGARIGTLPAFDPDSA